MSPTMPFGRYVGKSLDDIPTHYLTWAVRIAREPLRTHINQELCRRDQDQTRTRAWQGLSCDRSVVLQIVRTGFRKLVMECHPDHGGNHASMVKLNAANSWLMKQLEVLR